MNFFLTWFIVMFVVISILAIIILVPNYLSALRELRQDGVKRPNLVIRKRILAIFFGGKKKKRAEDMEKFNGNRLRDIPVWFSWDIRWLSAGTMVGRIVDVVDPDVPKLLISFSEPIEFGTGDIESKKAFFEPYNQATPMERYNLSGIYGSLRPIEKNVESVKFRDVITCELVTLSKA